MNTATIDDLDAVLDAAFERALTEDPVDLVETVLRRVRRRQHVRIVVLGLAGAVAAAIALANGLPVIDVVRPLLTDLPMPAWHFGLPAVVTLAGAGAFCGWLLLEEPV